MPVVASPDTSCSSEKAPGQISALVRVVQSFDTEMLLAPICLVCKALDCPVSGLYNLISCPGFHCLFHAEILLPANVSYLARTVRLKRLLSLRFRLCCGQVPVYAPYLFHAQS